MSSYDPPPRRALPDETYVELVGSLCSTRLPAAIMTGLFLLVGLLATTRSGDRALAILLVLGLLASTVRLAILFRGRRIFAAGAITPAKARVFERVFGGSYIAFAGLFGCFAARVIALPLPALYMPVGILVVGYAAGVAATVALRPQIAIPGLLLGVVPLTVMIALRADSEHIVSALCLAALLLGGLRSLVQRYRSQSAKATTRHISAQLARRDHLTGLFNRFALGEAFAGLGRSAMAGSGIAVHYIDLDDFKPVNDLLGHLAGDELLAMVADRIRAEIADGDIAARLGGDEFVIVQTRVSSQVDVTQRAARIETVLAAPFELAGQPVIVGASVGSCGPSPAGLALDLLLSRADRNLRMRKAQRKGIALRSRTEGDRWLHAI